MCGLTGIFSSKPLDNLFNLLSRMNANLSRGPDDEGIWIDQNIGFGHKRLSVMDLGYESGKQPMQSQCDRYVIILMEKFIIILSLEEI